VILNRGRVVKMSSVVIPLKDIDNKNDLRVMSKKVEEALKTDKFFLSWVDEKGNYGTMTGNINKFEMAALSKMVDVSSNLMLQAGRHIVNV
jgi:hypothetical protein